MKLFPSRVVSAYVLAGIGTFLVILGSGLLSGQLFYTGWSIIVIGLCCYCICGRLWIINHRTKHQMPRWLDSSWTLVGSIVACAITCFLAAFFMAAESPEPPPGPKLKSAFLARVDTYFMFETSDRSSGFCFVDSREGIMPVFVTWYFQLTNLKAYPIMVDSYFIEIRSRDGKWHWLPQFSDGVGTLFLDAAGYNLANRIELNQPTFESALKNKSIGFRETVQGWLFLGLPSSGSFLLPGGKFIPENIRLRVRDTTGNEYFSPIELTPLSHTTLDEVQTKSFKMMERVDLTSTNLNLRIIYPFISTNGVHVWTGASWQTDPSLK